MGNKILFLASWYPNPKDKTHGIFVKRYAEAIALFNDVAVIHVFGDESFSEHTRIESKTDQGVKEVYVYYRKKKLDPLSKFKLYQKNYQLGLNHLLKEWGQPDLIQVNVIFPVAVAALPIIKKLNVPYVISEHWTGYHPEDGGYKGFLMHYFTKSLVKGAKAIITVSSHLKKSMMLRRLEGNYHVIPNVVNEDVFKYVEEPAKNKFRFLHVSSLDPRQKNVEGIIQAFKEFHAANPASELIIAGDGNNRLSLEKLAGQELNTSVFFTGNKFNEELAAEYNRADCFLLFSNYENLPVVLLEARCCGLPVITTNVGGISEFLSGEDVAFVKTGDKLSLLRAMETMHKDFNKFDRRSIAGDAIQKFGYDTIGKRFTELYNEILK